MHESAFLGALRPRKEIMKPSVEPKTEKSHFGKTDPCTGDGIITRDPGYRPRISQIILSTSVAFVLPSAPSGKGPVRRHSCPGVG